VQTITVCRDRGVATITLNRPETKNAFTREMWVELHEAVTEIESRAADRVVVLTGAGGNFSSGADLNGFAVGEHPLALMTRINAVASAVHRLSKPSIAKVDGVAIGAGMNLALGCDLVVASDRARFSQIFTKRALSVDFGGSWLLTRRIGLHKAKELCLLADMLSAADAAALGLVNRVVAADELDAATAEWATRLAAGPPVAYALTKQLLDDAGDTGFDAALAAEANAQTVNLLGADVLEAFDAFREKRTPNFGPSTR
jgi:2-(1,2-epoxy-1,2-dihydrophenyl)acetyl-CoA isomerase